MSYEQIAHREDAVINDLR